MTAKDEEIETLKASHMTEIGHVHIEYGWKMGRLKCKISMLKKKLAKTQKALDDELASSSTRLQQVCGLLAKPTSPSV